MGTHGTVVVTGLFGMQGGSVVELVELVGPTAVVGGTAVVVEPGGVLVVVGPKMVEVVVVPAGPPAHPNDCNSAVKIPPTPGRPAKLVCTDRSS